MKTIQSYKINEIKKLIDLNGHHKNFSLNFKATSADSSPFKAIVVDQVSLESNNIPDYKVASDGIITGNVKSDSGVYLNYFLMLKSDEPIVVDVEIDLTPLPDSTFDEAAVIPQNTVVENSTISTGNKKSFLDKKYFGVSLRIIIIVLVLAAAGGFVYFKFFKKPSSNNDSGIDVENLENNVDIPELSLEDALADEKPLVVSSETVIKSNIVSPVLKSTEPLTANEVSYSPKKPLSSIAADEVPPISISNQDSHSILAVAPDSSSTRNNSVKVSQHSTPQKYTNTLLNRIQNLPDL